MARPKGGGGDARERLLAAVGRGFRSGGYGGVGVDALAKEAGLTSGAFYATFGSKAEAFTTAVTEGLRGLHRGIASFQQAHGHDWVQAFVDFYLGELMASGLPEACALPSFTTDVARSGDETRAAYTDELGGVVALVASGLSGPDAEERAWRLLYVLSGATSMARAVVDPDMRGRILKSAHDTAMSVVGPRRAGEE